MTTKQKGDIAEGAVLAALIKRGRRILLPIGENHRYDLVIDDDGTFTRVQCKAGHLKYDGAVIAFNACSIHAHRGKPRKHYLGDAEFFGVYCAELDRVFLVPVGDVGKTKGYLRVKKSRYSKFPTIHMAAQYEI